MRYEIKHPANEIHGPASVNELLRLGDGLKFTCNKY